VAKRLEAARRASRYVTVLVAAACSVALPACSGSKTSGNETIARIAGVGSISKAMLEHWIPIEAVVLYENKPARPVPKGVIPDPPNYTACVAHVETMAEKPIGADGKPSKEEAKAKCREKYAQVREYALNTLIGWYWTIGSGKAFGFRASNAEAKRRLSEVNRIAYPREGEFARYLRLTGQTVDDMLLRSKVQLYEVKIGEARLAMAKRLPAGLGERQRQAAFARFAERVPSQKQWAAKTSCRKGYVVSACREYKGSQLPGLPD